MKFASIIFLFFTFFCASAQIVISSNAAIVGSRAEIVSSVGINNLSQNVDLSTSSLTLKATAGIRGIRTSAPLSLTKLTIDSDVDYAVAGTWSITDQLNLTKGKLVLDRTTALSGKLVYSGANDLVGSATSYVQGPLFIKGTGLRTWPIGDTNGFGPVSLQSIADTDKDTELGFDISADPGFTTSPTIAGIYNGRFWQFINGNNGSYAGSQISLSAEGTDTFFADGKSPTVLERDGSGGTNDLGGSLNNSFFTSNKLTSNSGRFYAIAKTDEIKIKVHQLITPDDDQKNEVLVIEGIDASEKNEVTILDRWGVVFNKWPNFKNYADPSKPQQIDVDFTRLTTGNYVVVVKYTERGAEKSVKQMITVLK